MDRIMSLPVSYNNENNNSKVVIAHRREFSEPSYWGEADFELLAKGYRKIGRGGQVGDGLFGVYERSASYYRFPQNFFSLARRVIQLDRAQDILQNTLLNT